MSISTILLRTSVCVFFVLPSLLFAQILKISNTFIDVTAPEPYVDVSKVFPDRFELRQKLIPATNKMVAWYISRDQVTAAPSGSYRALSVQTIRQTEGFLFTDKDFVALKAQLKTELKVANTLDFVAKDLEKKIRDMGLDMRVGAPVPIGVINESPETMSILIALSYDDTGGKKLQSVAIVTYCLVKQKLVLLCVNCPSAVAEELEWAKATMRKWIENLKANNS